MDTQVLVARAQDGDSEAFGHLYELFAPRVYRYLYHHLNGRSSAAEDLAQEVFVKVLEKLGSYRDLGLPFSAWLFRIAHNHLVDHLRGQPKTPFASIEDFDHLPEYRAERSLERVLTHFELAGALSYLTEGQRRVVSLRFLQGLSLDETTHILGKSEDAVKKLQARGLQALKKVMKTSSKALVAA